MRDPKVAAECARAFVHTPFDLFARLFLGPAEIDAFAGAGQLNTDDNALLEFSAPLDLVEYARYEGFFRDFYHGDTVHGRVMGLVSDLDESDAGALAGALLRHGKLREAAEILEPRVAAAPEARHLLLLARLAQAPLDEEAFPYEDWLPRVIPGVPQAKMARFWDLHRRELLEDALELLAALPPDTGLDASYAILSAFSFLRDDMAASAVEVLRDVAGHKGGPLSGFLLGRALLEQQRYREGFEWLDWAVRAGLDHPLVTQSEPSPVALELGSGGASTDGGAGDAATPSEGPAPGPGTGADDAAEAPPGGPDAARGEGSEGAPAAGPEGPGSP
jgi:tetratricopeptide (TPR) repeat protein